MSPSKTMLLAGTILSAGLATQAQAQIAGSPYTNAQRFDAMGRVTGTISADPDGTGPLPHRAMRTSYDPAGRVTKVETGTLETWQSEQVAPANWSGFIVHQVVDSQYDALDRKTRDAVSGYVTPGSGTPVVRAVTQQSYDQVGRPKCSAVRMNLAAFPASGSGPAPLLPDACVAGPSDPSDPSSVDRITRNQYDEAGQLTKVYVAVDTAAEAIEVTNIYNDEGQIEALIDGNNNRTTYTFDGYGRPKATFFPVDAVGANASSTGDYEQVTLDPNGNVTQRRVRDGQLISMTYDALNRVILKDLPGAEPDVSYVYDLLGKVKEATQPGLALSFTYDGFGRQLTQTSPVGTVRSAWDAGGRRTRITYPDNYYVDQDHLVTGELIAIRENGATAGSGVLATYGYDGMGRRISMTRGNGTSTAYGYDSVGRLASLRHELAGTAHDATRTFAYNPAGQIGARTNSNDLYAYTLLSSGSVAASHDGLNRVVDAGGPVSHDPRGNLIGEGGRTFSYSSENLLTGLTAAGRSWTLTYDPMLRLQHTTTSGATSRTYAYDGDNALMSLIDGQFLTRNVFGPGASEPLFTIDNQGRRIWFIADERGSIIGSAGADGVELAPIGYDDYRNSRDTVLIEVREPRRTRWGSLVRL